MSHERAEQRIIGPRLEKNFLHSAEPDASVMRPVRCNGQSDTTSSGIWLAPCHVLTSN